MSKCKVCSWFEEDKPSVTTVSTPDAIIEAGRRLSYKDLQDDHLIEQLDPDTRWNYIFKDFEDFCSFLGHCITAGIILLLVSVPLAAWKLVELIIQFYTLFKS